MSFVTTQPDALAVLAGELQGLGSAMNAGNAAAAAPTTGVVPAAVAKHRHRRRCCSPHTLRSTRR